MTRIAELGGESKEKLKALRSKTEDATSTLRGLFTSASDEIILDAYPGMRRTNLQVENNQVSELKHRSDKAAALLKDDKFLHDYNKVLIAFN